jgi:hypothetical protein
MNGSRDHNKLITLKQVHRKIVARILPVDFFGDLRENYEKHNAEYINGR